MLRPLEVAGVSLVLLFAALTFARTRTTQIWSLAAVIGLSIALDRSGVSALFKVYSYGRLPDHAAVVSHYNAGDLTAAHWLHDNMRNAIVVSDPYTLGLVKAVAGVAGIYLFSNLDTVNEAAASQIKGVISAIVKPDHSSGGEQALSACAFLSPLLANLNQEALAQMEGSIPSPGILKPVRAGEEKNEKDMLEKAVPHNLDDITRRMEVLNTRQGKWNLVAIINPRTIEWIHLSGGQRLSYFPAEEPLNHEVLNTLHQLNTFHQGPFRVLFSDEQNAIVSIECTEDVLHSSRKTF
jgi:hypothetical protein